MNRGSEYLLSALTCRDIRFNEAPIHESGKYRGAGLGESLGKLQ